MTRNITKARIADAAIAYVAAETAYDNAVSLSKPSSEMDSTWQAMHDAKERLAELVYEWNRLQEVLNR